MKKILFFLAFLTIARILGDDCNADLAPVNSAVGGSYSKQLPAKPTLFIKRGLREQALEMQEDAQKDEEVVKQKMRTILIDLCKKYDACAVIIYKEDFYNILYIDPAYDITQEAFDRLNREYLESKAR